MPRRQTPFIPGSYYHLYNRGVNRQTIFFERENSLYFLRLIRHHLIDSDTADILAYCLMPNHYHVLIQVQQPDLSTAMQRLSLSYTKAMNKRYQRVGPLFQGPFHSILVDRDDYLLQLSHYIHLNPVKAQFADRPQDWEFSSYHEYAGLRNGTLPNTTSLQRQFGPNSYSELLESTNLQIQPIDLIPLLLDF
jgi:putative transposase